MGIGTIPRRLTNEEYLTLEAEAEDAKQRTLFEMSAVKGHRILQYEHAKEKYKPIIEATTGQQKDDVIDSVRDNILNNSKLSNPEKLAAASELDKMKLVAQEERGITTTTNQPLAAMKERKAFLDRALRIQDDRVFGIVLGEELPEEDTSLYDFGFEELYRPGLSRLQLNKKYHLGINLREGEIGYDYINDRICKFSNDLITLLTSNTIIASVEVKNQYMEIIDATLGESLKRFKEELDHLRGIEERDDREDDPRFRGGPKLRNVHASCADNVKFKEWIAPKYKIPIRLQPKRGGAYGEIVRSDDEGRLLAWATSDVRTKPVTIVIPPDADDRLKRVYVLLGKKNSSKEDVPAELAEVSALLDALLKDKKINIEQYKSLMSKYK
jgi:hypothetical protein